LTKSNLFGMNSWHIEMTVQANVAKTTPTQIRHPKVLHNKYILVLHLNIGLDPW
jgi:hypothetical protein